MKRIYVLSFIIIILTSVLFAGKRGILTVEFINVGEGDSVLIITPSKYVVLLDGGSSDKYSIIKKVLRKYKIKRIDEVILSNPKSEHVGGLISVIKDYDVGDILDSGMPFSKYKYENFLETIMKLQDKTSLREDIDESISDVLAKKHHYEYFTKRAGDVLSWGPDVEVSVLNPPGLYNNTESDPNNNSLVIKLVYGRVGFLFAGDVGITAEKYLVTQGYKIKADILKVPNHGSSDSGYNQFINTVKPKLAVISVGENNPYGNPDKNILKKYKNIKSKIYRTDLNGSVKILSDGVEYSVHPEKQRTEKEILATAYKNNNITDDESSNKNVKIKGININTASVEDLLGLPGLGVFKAQMIIRYRNKHGRFKSVQDLIKVPGINSSIVNKIKDKILIN